MRHSIQDATRIKLAQAKQDVAKAKTRVRRAYKNLENLKAELEVSSSILNLGFREYDNLKQQVQQLRAAEHVSADTGKGLKNACRAVICTYLDEIRHPKVLVNAREARDRQEA